MTGCISLAQQLQVSSSAVSLSIANGFVLQNHFFDIHVFDAPRSQLIDKLCELAEESGVATAEEIKPMISMIKDSPKANPGTPMSQVCLSEQSQKGYQPTHGLRG